MIKKIVLGGLILLSSSGLGWAQKMPFSSRNMNASPIPAATHHQQKRTCATPAPDQELEKAINQLIQTNSAARTQQTAKIIPVIVHVVHTNTSVGSGINIPYSQVQAQIATLNADYAGTGYNSGNVPSAFANAKANTEITFCLAKVDPNGNTLSEAGVERFSYQSKGWQASQTVQDEFGQSFKGYDIDYVNSTIKPSTIWNPSKYLNIWVVEGLYATIPNVSYVSAILGFAQPPTASSTSTVDGVVISNNCFGSGGTSAAPYNRGRTASHEIGHWCGLRHVWGDANCGDDGCADTPTQADANYGCPTYPLTVANPNQGWNGPRCNTSDPSAMFMNFMDYVDDACMYMFTNDQKTKMNAYFTGAPMRAAILNSTVCNSGTTVKPVANFSATPTTVAPNTNISVSDLSSNTPTTWKWTVTPSTGVTITTATSQNPTIKFANAGTYTIKLKACNTAGCDSITKTSYITVSTTTTSSCDTLQNFSNTAQLTSYAVDEALPIDSGYLAGTNIYGDLAKAEKFAGYPTGMQVEGVFAFLSTSTGTGTTNFTVWAGNGANGSPNSILGSVSVPLNTLNASTTNLAQAGNYIAFNTPIVLGNTTTFYAGFTIPSGSGNVIAALHTAYGETNNDNAWEQWGDNTWKSFGDANAWSLPTDLIIMAKLCPTSVGLKEEFNTRLINNVNLFPNPSNGIINLAFTFDEATTVSTVVTNMLGETVYTALDKNITLTVKELNLSNLSKGSYLVSVKTDKGITTKKVVLE